MTDRIVPLSEKTTDDFLDKDKKVFWDDVQEAVEGLKQDDEIIWKLMCDELKKSGETSDQLCSILSDYRVKHKELIDARFEK
jgi:hypothetical protein